jgi:ferredoxin
VAIFEHGERCIACGACVLQCPRQAIALVTPSQKQLAAGNDHNQLT